MQKMFHFLEFGIRFCDSYLTRLHLKGQPNSVKRIIMHFMKTDESLVSINLVFTAPHITITMQKIKQMHFH